MECNNEQSCFSKSTESDININSKEKEKYVCSIMNSKEEEPSNDYENYLEAISILFSDDNTLKDINSFEKDSDFKKKKNSEEEVLIKKESTTKKISRENKKRNKNKNFNANQKNDSRKKYFDKNKWSYKHSLKKSGDRNTQMKGINNQTNDFKGKHKLYKIKIRDNDDFCERRKSNIDPNKINMKGNRNNPDKKQIHGERHNKFNYSANRNSKKCHRIDHYNINQNRKNFNGMHKWKKNRKKEKRYINEDLHYSKNNYKIEIEPLFSSNNINNYVATHDIKTDHISSNIFNNEKMKKLLLIIFRGLVVIIFSVSNNISGKIRNQVLTIFDNLTASYNTLSYLFIYFFLLILLSRYKYINKKHWLYIYPCFKKDKNINGPRNNDIHDAHMNKITNYKGVNDVIKSENNIEQTRKRKGKNKRGIRLHLDASSIWRSNDENYKIQEPLLGHFYVEKDTYNNVNNNELEINERENHLKIRFYEWDKRKHDKEAPHSSTKKCETESINKIKKGMHNKISSVEETNSTENTNDVIKYDSVKKTDLMIQEIMKENKFMDMEYTTFDNNNNLSNENVRMSWWFKLGGFKYVVIIGLLDIIANTLYFVSQSVIPLTVLLLLNQLNFVFSIVLSYSILRKKYNIQQFISVLVVFLGFLLFYIPYVHMHNELMTMQNHTKESTLFYFDDFHSFSSFYFINQTTKFNTSFQHDSSLCSYFNLFHSILLCIFSIFLTAFCGILRELFFEEYKQKEKIRQTQANEIELVRTKQKNILEKKNYPILYSSACLITNNSIQRNKFLNKLMNYRDDCNNVSEAIPPFEPNQSKLNAKSKTVKKNDIFMPVNKKNDIYNGEDKVISYSNSKNNKAMEMVNLCEENEPVYGYSIENKNDLLNVSFFIDDEGKRKNTMHNHVNKKENNVGIVILSFNVSLMQFFFLPLILYFQLFLNVDQNISYIDFLKDSLMCYQGKIIENNKRCKYALTAYLVYLFINIAFNLSVTYFLSIYSSAEVFLLLKSSTPITLTLLYFCNFPFISDSEKYFSILFIVSTVIVFSGIACFFFQSVMQRYNQRNEEQEKREL